ncbi:MULTISPECIES: glycerol-3-phosphate dehydrogenase/oxidase [Rhizobium]|uniref:Glycerol-3-phosphate dehydrogenase n=1 Tax=Rhizobium tropici TaxID=398 RepID=A0A329Y490_RHITR|nr:MULTISPECIES: glycerol-3-phosphate dehydrogenase/oxidase [Rhizobium]MBB3285766.1 glycerol-3-phosphate dehydrogenase [Rhizobium sp. BK252]MBB3400506.1 glycerol-3-phosphate dehydrogenase [Rhizobium sp. BK289]MBB3413085.1 glycerol-3-phosphate dehydrogenase [Rhizobium sp. BK284]MBB3480972.1 glycerol-3-phosphate dehydrogenase [Rhizobium sp. BK347]MDK4721646.1 glycerol-3-phosphate dehydrogenase/oxidase [Rhizobium sp. CNPSo 3968]
MTDMAADLKQRFSQLQDGDVDVVILGAGVNGAGLFRDLSLQGINCLIVDKSDFGSGTSAAPSRLIHGGLKYLETGEFGLVAQSALERNLLLKNAPHCVEALPTFVPIFSWTRGIWAALRTLTGSATAPRSRGALLIKIGLALYDFFGSRNRVMPRHRFLLKRRALKEMPHVTPEIVAGGIYYDAKISRPERLVYELVNDGLEANKASLATNSTRLVSAADGVLTFQRADGYAFSVKPKLVVNAAGPWIDHVNAALGAPAHLIGGTKGSHILLDHPELVRSLNGHMIYFEADDGRICLVYGYLGQALVGSTDIPCDDPDNVRCEEPEIDYFLDSVRSLLPSLRFDRDQVTYSYSGIRPLPASDASSPGLISRDHSAPVFEPQAGRPFPIISLVGGKWTTFRGFAEEVADIVLARLQRGRKTSTERLAIGGGRDFPVNSNERASWIRSVAAKTGAEASRVDELLGRYGTTAAAILAYPSTYSDSQRISGAQRHSALEIDWIARQEMVVHLSDIVFRRTTMAIEGLLTIQGLREIGAIAAAALQWDAQRLAKEIDDVVVSLSKFHGQTLSEDSVRRAAGPAMR